MKTSLHIAIYNFKVLFLSRYSWFLSLVKSISISFITWDACYFIFVGNPRYNRHWTKGYIGRYSPYWSNSAHRLPPNSIMRTYPTVSSFESLENRTRTGHNNMTSHHHYTPSTWFQNIKFFMFLHLLRLGYIIKSTCTFTW